jgi:molybdenum cofactor cytidylyltransferase
MADIAAIILAAGKSSRYLAAGGAESTKLVAEWRGRPMVRAVAEAALGSRARPVIAVTGHARGEVEAALAGLPLGFVDNPNYPSGLASSLRTGLEAAPESAAGAIVLLGDMPDITAAMIDRVIAGFLAEPGAIAAIPVHAGLRGNPVLLGRRLFDRVAVLQGDEGARGLLREAGPEVVEVALDEPAVALDIDTPGDLAPGAGKDIPS